MQSLQTKLKGFKQYEPIPIKEPYNKSTIRFENTQEFTAYYRENEEDFKNISTQLLNRTYKIPGYKIRQTGVDKSLILVKDYAGKSDEADGVTTRLQTLEEQVQQLQSIVHHIEQFLQQFQPSS